MTGSSMNLRNVLVLLGVFVTSLGLIYFANEFFDRISDWGRLISLVLLGVLFASLGLHFQQQGGDELVDRAGWRWLRVTSALYILALVSGVVAVIVFLGMDQIDRSVRVLVTIAAGLGLILVAARRMPHGS